MTKRIHPVLSLAVAVVLHFLGDYVLQKLLPFPNKSSLTGLILHCLYADTLAYAWVGWIVDGWRGMLFGIALAPIAHLCVDSLHIRGSVLLKLLDQGLHLLAMALFVVAILSPYPVLEESHG